MTDLRKIFFENLKKIVVITFIISIILGFFLPVYTDEVGWRLQERAALDGVDKMFSDACGSNSLAAPPFFMMPVRYFSSILNVAFDNPIFVRLSGVGYALVWAFLLLRLIARIARNSVQKQSLTIIAISLMSLGVMPLLLVWSRPEQPILLCVTSALLIWWTGAQEGGETTARAAWGRSMGLLILGLIAVSYHVKALVLLPVFLACMASASRGRLALPLRVLSSGLLAAASAMAAVYWVHRLQCPDDAVLRAKYESLSIGLQALQSDGLMHGLATLFANLNLGIYPLLAAPSPEPMSKWLAPGQIDAAAQHVWWLALALPWLAALVFGLARFVIAAAKAIWRREADGRAAMALIIFGSAAAWCATLLSRNVYEAVFVLPLFMFAIIFALSTSRDDDRPGSGLSWLAAPLAILALGSQLCILVVYGPSLASASSQTGFVVGQPNSISVRGYASLRPDILGAAKQCGIEASPRVSNLLLDEMTYFTFMTSFRPQFRLGVFGLWKGSIADPIAYLRERGSDGVIVSCQSLPPDLLLKARRQGQFCCLSAANW